MKVHRWQITGKTPCGMTIEPRIITNVGRFLSDGVTCQRCLAATTLVSVVGERWNGQSRGYPQAEATGR